MKLVATEWTDIDSNLRIKAMAQADGSVKFAVLNNADSCLNKDGKWEYQPLPSSRDSDFLSRCRYDDFNSAANALERAEKQP